MNQSDRLPQMLRGDRLIYVLLGLICASVSVIKLSSADGGVDDVPVLAAATGLCFLIFFLIGKTERTVDRMLRGRAHPDNQPSILSRLISFIMLMSIVFLLGQLAAWMMK